MRVLIAPQEFKGSLTAAEAARVIAEGVHVATPDATIDEAPMSDGGAGLVDAMLAARAGQRIETEVHDPLMRPVRAGWGLLSDGIAVIEMAAASGLVLLAAGERAPLIATTYGTGELVRAALDRGCRRFIVGVGGSATVDAGAGAMQALGVRLLDVSGSDLPCGGAALGRLASIDLTGVDARLVNVEMRVASDVTNTLCGSQGAAMIFGPQKGASEQDARALDEALARFAEIVRCDTGIDLLTMPGGGAAGGLGTGLVVVAGATIEPGFAIVAEAARLEARIAKADLVITGEGRLDAQTSWGKTVAGVAKMARSQGKRVGVIAGTVSEDFDWADSPFDAIVSASPGGVAVEEAMRDAGTLVRRAAESMIGEFGVRP